MVDTLDILKPPLPLSDEVFQLLRDFIYERTGLYFNNSKKYLFENRLYKRIIKANFKTYEEYYYFLKYDPRSQEEIATLFDTITTNETSFFRNLPQLEAFKKYVLPKIIEDNLRSKHINLKIWSAGCSTGEEPYTLSMILMEHIGLAQNLRIEIIANDISQGVLRSAVRGIYHRNSIRNTPEYYLKKYFKKSEEDKYILKDIVKKWVQFHHINLIDKEKMKSITNIDVIFCRNVLIYFDETSRKEVIARFYDNLRPNGFLFIGHSESLHTISRAFKVLHFGPILAYKKE